MHTFEFVANIIAIIAIVFKLFSRVDGMSVANNGIFVHDANGQMLVGFDELGNKYNSKEIMSLKIA